MDALIMAHVLWSVCIDVENNRMRVRVCDSLQLHCRNRRDY